MELKTLLLLLVRWLLDTIVMIAMLELIVLCLEAQSGNCVSCIGDICVHAHS